MESATHNLTDRTTQRGGNEVLMLQRVYGTFKAIPLNMKTNQLTRLSKTLLAIALLSLVFGKAAAQINRSTEHQTLHATIPGECVSDGGETF